MTLIAADALLDVLHEQFPLLERSTFHVERLAARHLTLRQRVQARNIRPGGTVSGPTMMTLADTATYMLLLAALGPDVVAVTTSLTIHFLTRPPPADLIADVRLLRLGKRVAVADVTITTEGVEEPVAHATVSYAIASKAAR